VTLFRVALLMLQAIQGMRVQSGVIVHPDTVTVGDPFTVVVRVRAPRGTTIEFPQTPDSGASVEAIDPVQVTPTSDTSATENSAVYRVAAWNVGSLAIPFQDILVRDGSQTRRISLTGISVFVRSVLPPDSTQWVPKPPRDVIVFGPPWWLWLVAALVAAALLWLGYWLWKRRRRRPRPEEDPFVVAVREFERVEALGLVPAGERARHVVLMVEILRDYLARVVPSALASLTTTEMLGVLRGDPSVPTPRLAALLGEVDLVKFARRSVTADRALAMGREARAISGVVHERATAPDMAKAA
jgi:uncharacterized protein DUF4381